MARRAEDLGQEVRGEQEQEARRCRRPGVCGPVAGAGMGGAEDEGPARNGRGARARDQQREDACPGRSAAWRRWRWRWRARREPARGGWCAPGPLRMVPRICTLESATSSAGSLISLVVGSGFLSPASPLCALPPGRRENEKRSTNAHAVLAASRCAIFVLEKQGLVREARRPEARAHCHAGTCAQSYGCAKLTWAAAEPPVCRSPERPGARGGGDRASWRTGGRTRGDGSIARHASPDQMRATRHDTMRGEGQDLAG